MVILHALKKVLIDGKILFKAITVLTGTLITLVSWGSMEFYADYKKLKTDYNEHVKESLPRVAIFNEMILNQKELIKNQSEIGKDVAVIKYVFLYGSLPPQATKGKQ